jgi:hypothetical protein
MAAPIIFLFFNLGVSLLWGAPRIHGELLKLGFAVAQRKHREILRMAKNSRQ